MTQLRETPVPVGVRSKASLLPAFHPFLLLPRRFPPQGPRISRLLSQEETPFFFFFLELFVIEYLEELQSRFCFPRGG